MKRKSLADLRHQLEQKREQLQETIAALTTGLAEGLKGSVGELSAYDQHTADLGAETFERGKDVALRDNSRRLLADVQAALAQLDQGEYGICQDCGRPLTEGRLRALPWATRCIDCQKAAESTHDPWHRPVEELVIPFQFTEEDTVGFDREDSWQAVARFGTANTPQDIPGAVDYDEVYLNADEEVGIAEPLEAVAPAATEDEDGPDPAGVP